MLPKVILVTGCSSGLGLTLVKEILARGDVAVATLRKPEALEHLKREFPDNRHLCILELDVTQKRQVEKVFEEVKQRFGRLDVVISNAGSVHIAELEGCPEEEAHRIMEVNFWGNHYVSTAAVAFFRDVNQIQGGHLIVIGSFAGLRPSPGVGIYGASKAAALSATEALYHELPSVWNIKTTSIVLGTFQTSVAENAPMIPIHPAYMAYPELRSVQLRTQLPAMVAKGQNPVIAASTILDLVGLDREKIPIVLVVGPDAYAAVKMRLEYLQDCLKEDIERTKGMSKREA